MKPVNPSIILKTETARARGNTDSQCSGEQRSTHDGPVHVSHILNQVVCDIEKRREVTA